MENLKVAEKRNWGKKRKWKSSRAWRKINTMIILFNKFRKRQASLVGHVMRREQIEHR